MSETLVKIIEENGLKKIKQQIENIELKNKEMLENIVDEFVNLCNERIYVGKSTIYGWKSEMNRIKNIYQSLDWDKDKKLMDELSDELEQIGNRIKTEERGIESFEYEISEKKSFLTDGTSFEEFVEKWIVQIGKFRSGWSITKKDLFMFNSEQSSKFQFEELENKMIKKIKK